VDYSDLKILTFCSAIRVKIKGTFTPELAVKPQRGSTTIALLFL
jgi:hypothetical protein